MEHSSQNIPAFSSFPHPLLRTLENTVRTVSLAPLAFLLTQVPEIILEVVQEPLSALSTVHPLLVFAILLPLFIIASALTSGLTFALVRAEVRGEALSFSTAVSVVKARLFPLLVASAIAGTLTLCGFLLIVPGIYFGAIFLLVPCLVIDEPGHTTFHYLGLSKALTKPRIWTALALVVGLFAGGLAAHFLGTTLGFKITKSLPAGFGIFSSLLLRTLLSVTIGILFNIMICHFYFSLRKRKDP